VEIVDGKIVLKESSLEVGTTARQPASFYEEVTEDATMSATYHSFVTRIQTLPWGTEETVYFYDKLRKVGADFTSMEVSGGEGATREGETRTCSGLRSE